MASTLQAKGWYRATLIALLILLVAVSMLVRWRLDTVDAKGADVPEAQFSAARAVATLATVLGDEQPHPVDSSAAVGVRQRIIRTLQNLSYRVDVQDTVACRDSWGATCARVRNLVAIHAGTAGGAPILLSAHYDSVPAGPGASDDGSGVAVLLEVARMLKTRSPTRNSVMLLFTDGEEAGLLGAQAFAADNPHAKDIALVINFEARGTTGQAVMFQTGEDSGWLVDAYAATSKRPLTNSLLSEVYKLMPNDTDFTVFNRKAIPGLNFAYAEGLAFYHTPKDNLHSLDRGSLQQQGDNAYGLLGMLLDTDLAAPRSRGNHVYADILGMGVIGWPASWTLAIALSLFALFAAASFVLKRRHDYSLESVLRGFACFFVAVVLGAASAWLLASILAALHGPVTAWHSNVLANRALLWSLALLAAVSIPMLLVRRKNPVGLWVGVGAGWVLLGVLSAVFLPGASYLFILVSLALVVAALVAASTAVRWSDWTLCALLSIPALVALIVSIPLVYVVEIMMTFTVPGAIGMGVFLGLSGTLIIPLGASRQNRRVYVYTGCAVVLISAIASMAAPAYSGMQPQPVNIRLVQDAAGNGHVYAGTELAPPPDAVRQAMGADSALQKVLPWSAARFYSAPLPSARLPAPLVTVLASEKTAKGREVSVKVDLGPSTLWSMLLVPKSGGLISAEMAGHAMTYPSRVSDQSDYETFVCGGESCDGMKVKLTLTGAPGVRVLVVKEIAGLPPEAKSIAQLRDSSEAIAQQDGDETLVWSEVQL